ncbi:TetR/AcrR family transcriptional regulator [Mycobacterium sp. SMC-18]|uniref:TetR/AcrR family transcriptional regulator n=1 Tax=Mycobacteriaceae TaxID=1762 RepID=UPI0009274FC8|nr:TetR/AcrR family transcriptional regulator [Mycolicibacterium sp. 141076]MDX1881063.1 TetR/AcrR family transcriptional regulator [Mycolicibacterium sp. 141076]SHW52749.1 transcriptional regulator [Mycobacteroides abscessus subsp. abscessus]
MRNQAPPIPDDYDEDIDPRRTRSRNRLLDAAANLLKTGGVEAVTIDAVTKASKVARTTLYRHFNSSTQLLAATFERLLPQVIPPEPTSGTLRERLIELLSRQADLLAEAPVQVTTLAWAALGPAETPSADSEGTPHANAHALRSRVVEQYRQPFDNILQSADGRRELGDLDVELAICQLVGPLVFARLTGIRAITHNDCIRLVDTFMDTYSVNPATTRPDAS